MIRFANGSVGQFEVGWAFRGGEERMPDGKLKVILKDRETGEVVQRMEG